MDVQGFGAFREATSFDFTDADFFALVGPTGSGKSTVIDAVCFALYGSVPRYEDQRLNRYVITMGASEAKVSLDFDLSGSRYVATRVVRRTPRGAVSTKEARLERMRADGTIDTLAGAEREMNPAIEELLHLSFKHFTRCVALPQGEFAEFLRAKGEDRRDLLIRLLNFEIYQRVMQLAGNVAETAQTEIVVRRQDMEPLAHATTEALKSAKARAKSLSHLVEELNEARPRIARDLDLADSQDRAAAEARRLAGLLDKVAVPDKVRRYGEDHEQALQQLGMANRELSLARATREEAEAAVRSLPPLPGLLAASGAHRRLSDLAAELDRAKGEVAQAEKDDEAAHLAVKEGAERVVAATAAVDAVRSAQQAASLAQQLVVGEPCPVCLEIVKAIPDHEVPQDLSKAQAEERKAMLDLEELQVAYRKASGELSARKTTVKSLEEENTRLLKEVEPYPDAAALEELCVEVETKQEALERARGDEDNKNRAREQAQGLVDELASQMTTLQADFNAQRDPVVALRPPEVGKGSVHADWEALASWAGPAKIGQEEAAEAAETKARDHRQAAANALQEFIDQAVALDVPAEGDVVEVFTALSIGAAKAASVVSDIELAITKRKELEALIEQTTERHEVASLLHAHLRADRFPEWLIAEALGLLVADASKTLFTLTNGTFSLALGEKEFMVVDHANADEQRSARTLSGGETFQASLALALALSDQIRSLAAEGAPQLDALFLDEGFGTLDEETLDTVASTIENLGQSGRMVGIISHVRELADRVPVRFEIRKGPRSAAVEKVYA